ncbi:sensor histidine kinase [Catenuloplanes sp. NPDC051500]|uniref:sensor histidine kinase n=1 Tax=Catenuloplanes sp. NPDC051500 TaxID=3363959 RepID=UPI00378D71A1
MSGTGGVPWRRSLVVRLLAVSVLIAVCAITATAWLAVETTTRTLRQEQGRALADDRALYDSLIAHAATHTDWAGAADLLLSGRGDRRITLMTADRQLIAETGAGPSLLRARPSALIDPLDLDLTISGAPGRIDPRVTGPYRLPPEETAQMWKSARSIQDCIRNRGVEAEIVTLPTGRLAVRGGPAGTCDPGDLRAPTPTEAGPLRELTAATARCAGLPHDGLEIWFDPVGFTLAGAAADSDQRVRECAFEARKAQLRPYTAPPVLLFVTDPASAEAPPVFDLSTGNTARIAAVTAAVLAVAVLVTVVIGGRLVRPLTRLTEAATRTGGFPVVPVGRADEIGRLAAALNDLDARRVGTEARRREMVGDVAHELRTPLTNIRSWLEAAQDGLAPIDRPLVDLLLDEAVLLQHVIDDLRDLAAADAGDLRLHPVRCDLRELLGQVADAHRGTAARAGVTLLVDAPQPRTAVVDPERTRQLIGNLVGNAVRHTPDGGVVTLALTPGGIEVADTGAGIAPGDLPRVFDRFWRADASRSRATGGSGLGLTIARKIAQAHGGDLTVRSEPGAGATFTVGGGPYPG